MDDGKILLKQIIKLHPKISSSKSKLVKMDIPKSWTNCFLGQIFEVKGGIQKTPKRKPVKNYCPYLRVGNVYQDQLDLKKIEYFEITNKELEQFRLKVDDLLVVEGNGSIEQIGRSAIWGDEITDCIHQNHIIRCRSLDEINSTFVSYYLTSSFGRSLLKEISKSTSGLYTLSVGKLSSISIPLPATEEQNQIVFEIKEKFSSITNSQILIIRLLKILETLKTSILKQAFEGKLVPQDPNDEPSLELLKKIKNI